MKPTLLETMKANAERSWNVNSTKKAVNHYHAIANFDFVVTLTVYRAFLAFIKGLRLCSHGTGSKWFRSKNRAG